MSVLILGNGFDLSMGMKTSYRSYLESEAFAKLVKEIRSQNFCRLNSR